MSGSSAPAGAAAFVPRPAADSPFVNELHIAENRPERLEEVRKLTNAEERHHRLSASARQQGYPRHHHFGDARDDPLSDGQGGALGRQARLHGEADRIDAGRGRRSRPHRQGEERQVHHRLLAALQSEIRLHAREDPRRHDRRAGHRPDQPPHHARASARRSPGGRKPVTGGDGSHPRSRLHALVPGAAEADPHLRPAGREGDDQDGERARSYVDDRHHGRRFHLHRRRRLESCRRAITTCRAPGSS